MSAGQKAAQDTKGVINQVFEAGEDARKNVNSFADELTHGHEKPNGTGIHKDAQRTGEEIQKGVETAGAKVNQVVEQTQHANSK